MSYINEKIFFIPFKDYRKNIGGPSTFMANLERYLKSRKFKFYSNLRLIKKTSAIFFPITFDKFFLKYFKERNLPIIQRLDGIYYPQKHGDGFEKLNLDIKCIYDNFSTHIIFQSNYCKEQCFEILGPKPPNSYSIIINGVDKKIFYPPKVKNLNLLNNKTINFITTGNFRNLDMIEPIIIALDILKNKYNFKFTIIGPITNDKIRKFLNRGYIIHIKKLKNKKIADLLRKSDIMLYSHLNPPCPNSVIEAIACGIPVVGFNSGAMKELLFFSEDLLAEVSNKIFQTYSEFNPNILKDKIEFCIKNYQMVYQRALKYSYLYNFNDTGQKYLEVFINSFPSSK